MFSKIKIKQFRSHVQSEHWLKKYNLIVGDGACGKTGFLHALFTLNSIPDIPTPKQNPLIQRQKNYATIETLYIGNHNTSADYKVLLQPHQTRFFRNGTPVSTAVFMNDLPIFWVNLNPCFTHNLKMQYDWLKHKISKAHPTLGVAMGKVAAQIETLLALSKQKHFSILDDQKQKELVRQIYQTSQTWQNHVVTFLRHINDNLEKVIHSFSAKTPRFQMVFQPFHLLKAESAPLSVASLWNAMQKLLQNHSKHVVLCKLFFGRGFHFSLSSETTTHDSFRERQNQQLFLEIVAAMWFYSQYQLKPIFIIDDFDVLHGSAQRFLWHHAHNFAQIFISTLSLDRINKKHIPSGDAIQIISLVQNETGSTN